MRRRRRDHANSNRDERISAYPAHPTEWAISHIVGDLCRQVTVRLALRAMRLVAMRAAKIVIKASPGTQVGVPRMTENVYAVSLELAAEPTP
jgi:hypothetical protein